MLLFPIPKSRRMVREKRRRILHRSPLARATPAGISGQAPVSPLVCAQLCAGLGECQDMTAVNFPLGDASFNLPGLMGKLKFPPYWTPQNSPGLRWRKRNQANNDCGRLRRVSYRLETWNWINAYNGWMPRNMGGDIDRMGFPGGPVVKNLRAMQELGRCEFCPWVRKIP